MNNKVVIVSAARTAIGSFMGVFSELEAQTLGAIAIREAVKRAGIDPSIIDEVIIGHIAGTDPRGNPAREASLEAGLPISIPAFTVNKNCASSLKSISLASSMISSGEYDVMLAGGMENMTRMPYIIRNARQGLRMGDHKTEDLLTSLLEGMGMTAERLADKYGISREEQDKFAFNSQKKASIAQEYGYFDKEIVPVEVKIKKEIKIITKDEGVRPNTSLEGLAKLRPTFKEGGTVTAGNSSTINDAGAALLLMSEAKAKELGLKPLARVIGWASAGCEPDIMGIGPVPSTRLLLKKTGMNLSDFDLIELNEAFAAQSLAVIKELNLDIDKVNVNGGAIALGHPTGATGSVLAAKIIHEMKRRNAQTGLITLCIGGGQGMSLALENI
jgi:acetyl-CoA C-acetyltransferase